MKTRTLFLMTGFVIISILVLLALNLNNILTGQPESQMYLKIDHVRGSAVSYHNTVYTLNFQQQNSLVDILNRSVRIIGLKPGKKKKPEIDSIIIYQFDGQPDIVITPVAYINNNLVFSAPSWNPDGYLMELSDGDLQKLLKEVHEP